MAPSQFELLVRAHADAVQAYARALTSDTWLADEAVQETFVRAWKYQDSFRGTGSYEGWLLRICRNVIVDLAEARRRHASDEPLDDVIARRGEPGVDVAAVSASDVDAALRSLAPAQREILTLCGVLGYDYEGAAELLDVPVGTIRSRLHRARAALAEALHEATDLTDATEPSQVA